MTRYIFFLRYALNGLRRGGQRIIIAILAVAFGVMSLIAMADMADAIGRTLSSNPRVSLGGDLRLLNPTEASFNELQNLQENGEINTYSYVQEVPFLVMRTNDNGRAHFVQSSIGIDANTYPVAGELVISRPLQSTPADLLQEIGDAIITRDLATRHSLTIGDTVRIAQNDGTSATIPLTIQGIVSDTPSHTGSRIYYNLDTSSLLLNENTTRLDYVVISTDNPQQVALTLDGQVQQLSTDATTPSDSAALFDFMLRGAGILGLIVGGIGIANTMQVLLARRRTEVGILKTLGYSQRAMIIIFVLEAGLIGIIGSGFGVLLSLVLSQGLVQLFANISTLLVIWKFNAMLILVSALTGIMTTIIFAFYAILRTSRIRPSIIFRRMVDNNLTWIDLFKTFGFYGILAVPFAGITSLFLGSVVEGIAIVLFAIAGFLVLSLTIGFIMWLILRLLPTWRFNLLRMARNNMRKRTMSMLFAMIALFVGLFTLGFALTVVQVGIDQFSSRSLSDDQAYNVLVYTDPANVSEITAQIDAEQISYRYTTSISVDGIPLQIRDNLWDVRIIEGAEFNLTDGLYISDSANFVIGDEVTLSNGEALTIIGRYTTNTIDEVIVRPTSDFIVSRQTANTLATDTISVTIYGIVPPATEAMLAQEIGTQFLDAMILTRSDVVAEFNNMFLNLLGFAIAMAGLALLAGIMLIANVVSLNMLERYFEIGVMKAIGYTQNQIMIIMAMEYSLIGIIASVMALLGVQCVIMFVVLTQEPAQGILFIRPITAIVMIVFGVILTMLTALITAWQPLRVRPSVVLNEGAI
ncbi:MAG: FtsX-like permease family protein [Chloroflexota bacterium]